jgi:hypothetical protein
VNPDNLKTLAKLMAEGKGGTGIMMDITKRNKAQPSESPDATVQEELH